MRFLIAAVIIIAAVAFWWHFGPTNARFNAGFTSPTGRTEHYLIIATIGLLATQLPGRPVWLAPAIFIGLAIATAFLAAQGLRLPFPDRALAIAALVVGLLVAYGARPELWIAVLAVVFAGVVDGYAIGRANPGGASGDLFFFGGFALASVALMALGYLIGQAAGSLLKAGDASARVGAAVAGVGLYLTLIRFGVL